MSILKKFNWKQLRIFLIIFIIALALFLRIYGINNDIRFGFISHWDEPTVLAHATGIIKNYDLNPHFFLYPSVYIYIQSFVSVLYYIYSYLFRDVIAYSSLSVIDFALWGRVTTAIFGAATVFLVYLIGKELFNEKIGILSSIILAIDTFHIIYSQFITVDVPTAFFITLAFYFICLIFTRRNIIYYFLAGFFCGIAFMTKYTAMLIVLSLLVAHIVTEKKRLFKKRSYKNSRFYLIIPFTYLLIFSGFLYYIYCGGVLDAFIGNRLIMVFIILILSMLLVVKFNKTLWALLINLIYDKKIQIALLAILIGAFVGAPYSVLDYKTFLRDFTYEFKHYGIEGHYSREGESNHVYYFNFFLKNWPVIWVSCLSGLIILFFKKNKSKWILLSFPVVFFLVLPISSVRFTRNLIPLTPFIAILSAYFVFFLLTKTLFYLKNKKYLSKLIVLILILSFFWHPSLVISKKIKWAYSTPWQVEAAQWINSNLPESSNIAKIVHNKRPLEEGGETVSPPINKSKFNVTSIYLFDFLNWSLTNYTEKNIDFVVLSHGRNFFQKPEDLEAYDQSVQTFSLYKQIWINPSQNYNVSIYEIPKLNNTNQ